MDMTSRMTSHFRDAMAAYEQSMNVLAEPLAIAVDVLFGALANNGKILACGNGGSAADAQHFIAELVGRFERERLPLAGIALNTDTSILTAVGNDYGFDQVFLRGVQAFGRPGDVFLAMSTSGTSPNVVAALAEARSRGLATILMTGSKGAGQADLADHLLVVGHRSGLLVLHETQYSDAAAEYIATGAHVPETWLWRKLKRHRPAA